MNSMMAVKAFPTLENFGKKATKETKRLLVACAGASPQPPQNPSYTKKAISPEILAKIKEFIGNTNNTISNSFNKFFKK